MGPAASPPARTQTRRPPAAPARATAASRARRRCRRAGAAGRTAAPESARLRRSWPRAHRRKRGGKTRTAPGWRKIPPGGGGGGGGGGGVGGGGVGGGGGGVGGGADELVEEGPAVLRLDRLELFDVDV